MQPLAKNERQDAATSCITAFKRLKSRVSVAGLTECSAAAWRAEEAEQLDNSLAAV